MTLTEAKERLGGLVQVGANSREALKVVLDALEEHTNALFAICCQLAIPILDDAPDVASTDELLASIERQLSNLSGGAFLRGQRSSRVGRGEDPDALPVAQPSVTEKHLMDWRERTIKAEQRVSTLESAMRDILNAGDPSASIYSVMAIARKALK